jgi:hypothetical protein
MTRADEIKWKRRLRSIKRPFTFMAIYMVLITSISFEAAVIGILLYMVYGK